jgi:restriction system protein
MTFLEAAIRVLQGAGRPLTVNAIVEQALQKGLLATAGKTPEASMSAVLYRSVAEGASTIVRLAEPGSTRARRGSVRWTLRYPE